MDAAIFDAVGGLIAVVLGSGGGRVIYVRSRNAHQVKALAAEASAIEAYDDFAAVKVAVVDQAEAFASSLGPQSAETYRASIRKDLAAATELDAAYTAYMDAGDEHNPRRPHRRGEFMAMTSAYSKFVKRLTSAMTTLKEHTDNCDRLQVQVAGAAETRTAVAALISAAREIVGIRQGEGWQVNDLLGLLTRADHWLLHADASLESIEHLIAIDDLEEAQTLASQAHDLAQDLPARQKRILAECDYFMRRAGRVPSAIAKARVVLRVVAVTYAEVCSSGFEATLVAADAFRSGIAAQVAELRRLVQPEICDWEEADVLIEEIGGDLGDIERECAGIRGLKERLDEQMASVRRRGRELFADIAQVEANAHNRDGDQRDVFAALQKLGAEVDTLVASFSQPRPNPVELSNQVDRLSNLIERVERQSAAIDNDDDFEDIARAVIIGAAAVVGLDFLLDN